MNRPLMITAIGVVVVVVAIAANFLVWQQEVAEEPFVDQAAAPQAAAKAAADTAAVAAEKAREAARKAAAAREAATQAAAMASAPDASSDTREKAAEAQKAADAAQETARKAEAEAEAAQAVAEATAQAVKIAGAQPEPNQTQPQVASVPADAATAPPPAAAGTADPAAPSFDVVRINPKGDTVMAGRAAPGSKVTILDRGKVVGEAKADARGEWVFIPDEPLPPGTSDLTLEAETEGGGKVASESSVILVVPEQGKDIAGRPTEQPSQPLAIRVPREGPEKVAVSDGPVASVVLQKPTAGQTVLAFTIDAVDYDDQGRLNISGHGPEGAIIQLYLDNKFIGRGVTAPDRAWSVTPEVLVEPGLYTLRADHVDTNGTVVARISLPFARAEPLALSSGRYVIVQPGNSLWRIARRSYGTGFNYTVIYEANAGQIANPDLIFPGQIFALPKVN